MYLARSGSPGKRTASAYSPGSARTWIGIAGEAYGLERRAGVRTGRAGQRPAAVAGRDA